MCVFVCVSHRIASHRPVCHIQTRQNKIPVKYYTKTSQKLYFIWIWCYMLHCLTGEANMLRYWCFFDWFWMAWIWHRCCLLRRLFAIFPIFPILLVIFYNCLFYFCQYFFRLVCAKWSRRVPCSVHTIYLCWSFLLSHSKFANEESYLFLFWRRNHASASFFLDLELISDI